MSADQFKRFETEEEVAAKRQQRQAEWEKVRQPDDPLECPEEETRSLFEQLQANKEQKEKEFEDETKLRSSVKGLEDEEVQFLNYVSNRQMQIERERSNEEKTLIQEMKAVKKSYCTMHVKKDQKLDLVMRPLEIITEKVIGRPKIASVKTIEDKEKEKTVERPKTGSLLPGPSSTKKSQQQLLMGAIKRKSSDSNPEFVEEKKAKSDENSEKPDAKLMAGLPASNNFAVVAGVLPGLVGYDSDDSSSENTSNSSDSETDHAIAPAGAVRRQLIMELMRKMEG